MSSTKDEIKTLDIKLSVPKDKLELHDGNKKVEKITIISLFRSCEKYLTYLFKAVATLENTYSVEFEYFFLENDSTDDTRKMLEEWFDKEDKEGSLLLYKLKQDYKKSSHGMNHSRTTTIGDLRNKLTNNITPLDSDWCLMLDADIYFDPSVLAQLFATAPCKNNIGMVGAYAQQLFPASMMAKELPVSVDKNKMISVYHYYDTYSFVDTKSRVHYPNCAFTKCRLCENYPQGVNRVKVPEEEDVVEVNSCFGGFAIIETKILNDKRIRWGTVGYEPKMDLSLCEHVLFCDRLRTITGKKVVIVQSADKVFRTG